MNFANILFLDIETVPQQPDYQSLSEEWKDLWNIKASYIIRNKEYETTENVYSRAGIYAEFGKIICIGCGFIIGEGDQKKLSIKSFYGDNEALLLLEFCDMLNKWAGKEQKCLCAHNGKEFDFPYLCRRLIVNNLPIPSILNISGKKPWDVNHVDTMELWKFGDFKSYTSLNLLAHTLGVPTSKDDIDGSMVGTVYWNDRDIKRIVTYCQKDVITLTQVFLKMHSESLIRQENIIYK